MPGYQSLGDTPGSSAVSEMSLDDERPAGVPTFDMTAPAMPRPDQQSGTPASGAATVTQEIQIDGRLHLAHTAPPAMPSPSANRKAFGNIS